MWFLKKIDLKNQFLNEVVYLFVCSLISWVIWRFWVGRGLGSFLFPKNKKSQNQKKKTKKHGFQNNEGNHFSFVFLLFSSSNIHCSYSSWRPNSYRFILGKYIQVIFLLIFTFFFYFFFLFELFFDFITLLSFQL